MADLSPLWSCDLTVELPEDADLTDLGDAEDLTDLADNVLDDLSDLVDLSDLAEIGCDVFMFPWSPLDMLMLSSCNLSTIVLGLGGVMNLGSSTADLDGLFVPDLGVDFTELLLPERINRFI